ncbi:MAG: hypothetical protein JW954_08090 [Dehalococcoidaceae bacterium]|nr:hypothetical protein [Dehalococcoidaceae bacterium]
MSYLPQGLAGGISRLSELVIDGDKDWGAHSLYNLGGLSSPQAEGDIYYHDGARLQRLPASFGTGHNFLRMANTTLYKPQWYDLQEMIIYMTGATNRLIDPPILAVPVPAIDVAVVADASGGGHPVTQNLPIPEPVLNHSAQATTVYPVSGAVSHDEDGLEIDETTEANDSTADNMTLLQPDGAIDDWYAIGYSGEFDGIVLNISTVGADITLNQLLYSQGAGAWGTLTPILNQLSNYQSSGKRWFTFERPADWDIDSIAGITGLYWIRLKSSATGAGYSQPLGAQAWILVY